METPLAGFKDKSTVYITGHSIGCGYDMANLLAFMHNNLYAYFSFIMHNQNIYFKFIYTSTLGDGRDQD